MFCQWATRTRAHHQSGATLQRLACQVKWMNLSSLSANHSPAWARLDQSGRRVCQTGETVASFSSLLSDGMRWCLFWQDQHTSGNTFTNITRFLQAERSARRPSWARSQSVWRARRDNISTERERERELSHRYGADAGLNSLSLSLALAVSSGQSSSLSGHT